MTIRHPTLMRAGAAGAMALAAVLAIPPTTAFAQSNWKPAWDKLVASQSPSWKAHWKKLVAEANKEGSVVLIVPPSSTHRTFLAKEWPKAFPHIAISLSVMRGGQLIPKLKVERSAKKYVWDVVMTGSENGFQMRDAGMADPMRSEFLLPKVKDPKTWGGWDEAFMDKGHKYVLATRSFLKMPFYNVKLLSPAKVKAEGSKIFLDPTLKGKIIWHEPLVGGSGRTFAGVMLHILGKDGLKKFVTEQVVFTPKMMDLVERMARSQYAISLGPVLPNLLKRFQKAGVKVNVAPLGNTPEMGAYENSGGSNTVVVKDRPHPAAAQVFLNWYLSKPVAAALAKRMGEDSRRTDIPRQVEPSERPVSGVKYWAAQREDNTPENEHAQELIAQFRGKS